MPVPSPPPVSRLLAGPPTRFGSERLALSCTQIGNRLRNNAPMPRSSRRGEPVAADVMQPRRDEASIVGRTHD